MTDKNGIYRSRKQSFYRGTNDPVEVKGLKTVVIEGDKFTIELPGHSTVRGILIFKQQDGDKTVYETDKGYPFVISPDSIFVNLYGFNDTAINYFLESDEDKKEEGSFFKKLFNK
jgi:hypothetical protein